MASKNYLKINNKTTHFSAFVDFFLSKRFQLLEYPLDLSLNTSM